eukprot:Tbor_TRINITY_DN3904_c0_g1::TRINITY_DN3904_c0_g1_i1::g.714::m.714
MRRSLLSSQVSSLPLSAFGKLTLNISDKIISTNSATSYRAFAHRTSHLLCAEALVKSSLDEDSSFWGTSVSSDENTERQQMVPATQRFVRNLTPGSVLYTIRHDPGMTVSYYCRRYFGGDTPENISTLNHILWSQLKKYGKTYVQRGAKSMDTAECTWHPMQKTYGRITQVRQHRPEDEDLSFLKDYVPPVPKFPTLPPPIPAKVMLRRSSEVPSLPPWSPNMAVQETSNPPEHNEETKMSADAAATRSESATAAAQPLKISDTLKATVVAVMEEALVLVHREPYKPITHYMDLMVSDEHRLAASAAFKQLTYNGLLKKEKKEEGSGSAWVITPQGLEVLDALPKDSLPPS